MPISVLLVEDEPLWQQGISTLVSSGGNFTVVATVDYYQAAVEAFQALKPQVVLLDWKIKGEKDGLDVGEWILQTGFPSERIILISGSDPGSIPPHPFLFVPKTQIGSDLLPLLKSLLVR